MTITALITGKLTADPERRTGPSGKTYVLAKLHAQQQDGEAVYVTLFAFGTTTQEVLLALGKGAALSASGSLKLGVWTGQDGQPHVQASMVMDALITLHERGKVDKAVRDARSRSEPDHHHAGGSRVAQSNREAAELWRGGPAGH